MIDLSVILFIVVEVSTISLIFIEISSFIEYLFSMPSCVFSRKKATGYFLRVLKK